MKARNLLISFVLLVISLSIVSQDINIKNNDREMLSKHQEARPVNFDYKRIGNLNGPSYDINISERRPGTTGVVLTSIGYSLGLIMSLTGCNDVKKSIMLYNSECQNPTITLKVELGVISNGVGVRIRF